MAQSSFPFENVDTSETQFSQWARHIGQGVNGLPAGTELKPTGDGSGMNVKVPAGQAIVRGHYYVSTAQETLTVTTADATNPRIDNVVLELDPSANSIVLKVVAGTPAGSPVAPTPTQTDGGIYQLVLATVAVAAGATSISSGNVTDARGFIGYRFGVWTTATRPGSPTIGQIGYNTTLALPEYYNGSTWSPVGGTSVNAGAIHGYNSTWTAGNYRRNMPQASDANGVITASSNVTKYSPIYIAEDCTLDRISFLVTTTGGTTAAVGLYEDTGSGPGTRIASLGSIATNSTGFKELTVSQAVTAGVYWVGLYTTSTTLQMPLISNAAYIDESGPVAGTNTLRGFYEAVSLPATASPSQSATGHVAVWVRKA